MQAKQLFSLHNEKSRSVVAAIGRVDPLEIPGVLLRGKPLVRGFTPQRGTFILPVLPQGPMASRRAVCRH
jgi:hypothetical protein